MSFAGSPCFRKTSVFPSGSTNSPSAVKFHAAGSLRHFSPFARLLPEQFRKRFIMEYPSLAPAASHVSTISGKAASGNRTPLRVARLQSVEGFAVVLSPLDTVGRRSIRVSSIDTEPGEFLLKTQQRGVPP